MVARGDLTEEDRDQVVARLLVDHQAYRAEDATARAANPGFESCLEATMEAGFSTVFEPPFGSEAQLVGLIVADSGVERLLVAYVPSDVAKTTLAAITADTCEVFQSVP